ncbi:hypothetical protein [Actinophytocola sp.]|uniref:hypothetical protein n=1 Tax=Actinophytocola sp. TaxID=1872138 RepID=UPI00389B2A98
MRDFGRPTSSSDLRALARAVLDTILAGDRRPLAIAHPLEFICIPILRTAEFGACGHIWQVGQSALTIHCHSWHLNSYVVAGAVLNEVFAVTDSPDGEHHLLSVDSTGSLDRMTSTGRAVTVQDSRRTLHHAGGSYSLRAGVFHRSTPISTGPTITLLAATTLPGARDQIVAARTHRQHATRREELPALAARALTEQLRTAIDVSRPLTPAHEPAGTPPHRSRVPSPPLRPDKT